MKKIYCKALLGMFLMLGSGIACAQLGNGGAALSDTAKISEHPEDIMAKYADLSQAVLAANINVLTALNLKAEADKLAAQARTLTADSTLGNIQAVLDAQNDVNKALEQKLAAPLALDDNTRRQFSDGLQGMAQGAQKYAQMSKDLTGFKRRNKATGGVASAALFAVKSLPESIKNMVRLLQAASNAAKAGNLALPADVAQAIDALK